MGQGLSSSGFPGVCGPSLPCRLDAPLGVSRVRLVTAEGSAAWEVILSSEEARFQPSLGSGPPSPVPNPSEMPISEPPSPCARGGPGLRAASRPAPGCAVRATAAASLPQGPPPPSTSGRPPPPPGSESGAAAPPGGFKRPLELAGQGRAVRAAGPDARVWGLRWEDEVLLERVGQCRDGARGSGLGDYPLLCSAQAAAPSP